MAGRFEDEMLSMEELDNVAGGNYVELEKDLKFFKALGIIKPRDIPTNVTASNFKKVNQLVQSTWQKFNINMGGNEGLHNTYELPEDARHYANSRAGALRYAQAQSDRMDLDIKSYM